MSQKKPETIREFVEQFVDVYLEAKMREADVSDGRKVEHGSEDHIKDLEVRIADMTRWRDRQKKGSETRANYARIVNRLKAELASARRYAAKRAKK